MTSLRLARTRSATDHQRFQITDAAYTDTGLVRAVNEDTFVRRAEAGLWAVADGMGGHQGGAWASGVIAAALDAMPVSADFDEDRAGLEKTLEAANATIYAEAVRLGARVGSTVAALLVRGSRFAASWVGDSRLYRLREGAFAQLTRDHTYVQDQVDRGLLAPDQVGDHPMTHVLTRAVGAAPSVILGSIEGDVQTGDVFMLCSDGVHGVVPAEEIGRVLGREKPEAACLTLSAMCRAGGAPDNLTVIVAAFS